MDLPAGMLGRAYRGLCGFSWLRDRDQTRVVCDQPAAAHGPRHTFDLAWVAVGAEAEVNGPEWLP